MTELLHYSSAPVLTVDGTVQGGLARDLLRLEIEESTEGLKALHAVLVGPGPADGAIAETLQYLDGSVLDFGKSVSVSIGPPGAERIVFDGLVSALEVDFVATREPVVAFFAEDKLMRLRMTRRMKTYEQMSDADIAQEIASLNGLSADTAADGPTYDVVQQWNQSDLAFLRERAALIQAEIWMDGDTLNFKSRQNREATELTLVCGNELIEARIRADLAHQRTSVKVGGFDASERDAIDEDAGSETISAEVTGGSTGVSILESAFGDRVSYRVREAPLVSGEARAWARAEMLRRSRRFVTVEGMTSGTPDMVVGTKLTLDHTGEPFDGDGYYVTRVSHTYDLVSGHRTHFCAERATVNSGTL
jgi:Bacteriophage probable baseplate hub protein